MSRQRKTASRSAKDQLVSTKRAGRCVMQLGFSTDDSVQGLSTILPQSYLSQSVTYLHVVCHQPAVSVARSCHHMLQRLYTGMYTTLPDELRIAHQLPAEIGFSNRRSALQTLEGAACYLSQNKGSHAPLFRVIARVFCCLLRSSLTVLQEYCNCINQDVQP